MAENPLWQELRTYCLSFDGAEEDFPWNEAVFKIKGKVFVFTSGDRTPITLSAKPLPENREMFLQLPGVSVAKYVGRFGWLSMQVVDHAGIEIAKDMIAESYAIIGKKKSKPTK